ncbi:MAG: pyridoxamine kinase [Erysipelotrichaceae bacterium]|nr:pyridoxamine kinase [Erysipelotrichaceae bacterium]
MSKKILLINDMAGYGKVALAAMIPVLSHMKYEIFNLPTALVSNTLDYGKFDILETTDYMKNTIKVWDELQFEFDAISTGFIVSQEQTKLIADYCKKKAQKGTIVFCDPIMGDDGVLYNGVEEKTIDLMRELISVADYIVPNYTEAAYLAKMPYQQDGQTEAEYRKMIDTLRNEGAKSVVITSAILKDSKQRAVVGYDHQQDAYFTINFDEIPVRFPGTGDIFSAVFTGNILEGLPVKESAQKAMNVVKKMIEVNVNNVDKYKGIPLEMYLEDLEG